MRIEGAAAYDLGPVRGLSQPDSVIAGGEASSDLRSVLSSDEAAYFAELERMGPLTYGQRAKDAAAPPPVLGQRIDVRA